MRRIFILFLMITAVALRASGSVSFNLPGDTLRDSIAVSESVNADTSNHEFRKEKLIAAVLAFPIPFGFCGLHRIYLGSEPWVPVAYLVTGGGGFGILPLIDFIAIVTADEKRFHEYENNPNFFMWVR